MRHMMRKLALVASVALISVPTHVLACSCAPMTREAMIASADAAFAGRVIRIWRSADGENVFARVLVTARFKGAVRERATVTTSAYPTMCGYALERGRSYDFAAHRARRGMLAISICSMVPMNSNL
jgi:hypothetical protein